MPFTMLSYTHFFNVLLLSLCVACPLVIRLCASRAESIPITMCPVSVSCLFICVFSKLCLKIISQPTVFNRFFSYYSGIIPRRFYIGLVDGVAILRYLAIERPSTFSYKNGLVYSDATKTVMNTVLCVPG